jgi:hypothetical protein
VNLKKRLLSFATAGALATGTLLAAGTGVASAAPVLGTLTLTPATGNQSSTLTATTNAHCNASDTGIVGYMSGPGISSPNDVLQGNTPINLVDGASGLSFPVGSIFRDIFSANAINSPSGAYTVRIACIGADSFTETGEFSQVVNFTPTGTQFNATYATVVPAQSTTTTLAQNNASGSFGDSVTFTATVAPSGAAGSVQFKDGVADLGTPQTVNGSGVATFTTSSLSVGSHTISSVFTPSGSGFNGSTSNSVTHTVGSVSTSMSLGSNGPTAQYAPATFTATVSPAAAGTVTFSEGATTLGTGSVNSTTGVATYTTTALTVGTHSVTAHFAPSGPGASSADAGPIDHLVTAFAGVSLGQNVVVTVPSGALTIVLDDGADGQVDLGTAQINAAGDLLTASGQMDVVKVTDTRAGDPGWTASGIVTDFSNGTDAVNGYNLGWDPVIVSSSANQVGIAEGPVVAAATEGTPGSTPANPAVGLESSRVLAVAADNAGNGTARLGAALSLNIPTDVSAGTYAATLTLTVV